MKPALRTLLAASLLATGWLALQPGDDAKPAPAPAARAQGPAPRLAQALPQRQPRAEPQTLPPAAQPGPATLTARASTLSPEVPARSALPTAPALPTRPADWPGPSAAALAAWQGAPAVPAVPAAAGAAAAPASRPAALFPYQWIGRLDDGGAPQALLSSAQRSVGVRLGDVLDGRWRIDQAPDGTLRATVLASGEVLLLGSGAPAAVP